MDNWIITLRIICKGEKKKKEKQETLSASERKFTLKETLWFTRFTIRSSRTTHPSVSISNPRESFSKTSRYLRQKHHPRRARTTNYRLNCVKRGNRGSIQTSPIVRLSQQRHLFAIALVHVHVHPFQLEITTRRPRAGHKPEELQAILVPLHGVQFLAVQIVLASERHFFPPRIGYTRHVYPQEMDGRAWKKEDFCTNFGISRGKIFEMGKKLELAKSQYFFGIMDKSRERERGRERFLFWN